MDKHIGERGHERVLMPERRTPNWILPVISAAAVVAVELLAMDIAYERGRYMKMIKNDDPVVHVLDKRCNQGLLDPKEAEFLIEECRKASRK